MNGPPTSSHREGPPAGGAAHVPVLLDEVMAALAPIEGGTFIDATFGGGGYTRALLERGAAKVIAVDRDPEALARARPLQERWGGRLVLVEAGFDELERIAREHAGGEVDGIVFDLGVSSMQIEEARRGFSFQREGPLDMRMGREGPSARELVNLARESDLAAILRHFGEERAARRIARAIVVARARGPIERTTELADIVERCVGRGGGGRIHPATRTFQALRIAVNDELGQLVRALCAAERVLKPGGRLAVVTFHSLEDRIVKRFLRLASGSEGAPSRHQPEAPAPPPRFTRPDRALRPSAEEVARNPRARSARLRRAVRSAAPSIPLDPTRLGLPPAPNAVEALARAGVRR